MNYRLCPYSDDYMTFDEISGHYVLTEKAITDNCGINIRARLEDNVTVNADAVINRLLTTVSDTIYAYIHRFSAHPKEKDFCVSRSLQLRKVIQKAMEYQAIYMFANGDLYMQPDVSDGKQIHELSKDILLNSGILYSGV